LEYKLSILIPISEKHAQQGKVLIDFLKEQATDEVEIIPYLNKGEKTKGFYRNELMSWSKGEYLCFVDADDVVSKDYVSTLLYGIKSGPDCISLRGEYSVNGVFDGVFEHSIKYQEWKTTSNKVKYERNPNHLNCIKSSIAKQFKFRELNHGEDYHWSMDVFNSGLLKKEFYVDKVLYYYNYITK